MAAKYPQPREARHRANRRVVRERPNLYDDPTTMAAADSLLRPTPRLASRAANLAYPGGAAAATPAPPVAADPVARLVAERLSDRLAGRIDEQIRSGRFRPGDRLPTEQALATEHGVSRTVVREAVHQLRSRGLLRSRQGSGVYVTATPAGDVFKLDLALIRSVDDVLGVRAVRRALEGEAAALAAEHATRAQVAALRRAVIAIDRSVTEGRDGVDEDLAFHRLLAEASGNPHFARLLGFLEQYNIEAMRVTRRSDAKRADYVAMVRREHMAIVDAIALGDPALARRRALQHMRGGDRRLQSAVAVPAAPPRPPRPTALRTRRP